MRKDMLVIYAGSPSDLRVCCVWIKVVDVDVGVCCGVLGMVVG